MRDEEKSLLVTDKEEEDDWRHHKCCPLKKGDNFTDKYVKPLVAEFFGTLFLVYIGCMSARSTILIIVGAAHGLTLVFLVVIFGKISGAHVNPAVTLGVALSGNIGVFQGIFYVLAQTAGAITGAALVLATLDSVSYVAIGGGVPALSTGISLLRGTFMEGVITFILVLVILMTAVDQPSLVTPMAIGFALFIGILAGGPVTGGAVNPVRALGPAVIFTTETTDHWDDHWIYWVGPILGALASAVLFRFILASPKKRTVCHDTDPDEEPGDEEHEMFEKLMSR